VDTTTLLVGGFALALGLLGGYALARRRRAAPVAAPPLTPQTALNPSGEIRRAYDSYDEETRPTLVPLKGDRESGRNLAKLNPDEG
jgi:hypothetical protein